jgi:hypothetical protein
MLGSAICNIAASSGMVIADISVEGFNPSYLKKLPSHFLAT